MDNMKIMSISDNVALVYDHVAGDTQLIRCDCYFQVKYEGLIAEMEPMWLDPERSIIDMGEGLFVLNFGGTILECYGKHRNTVSEVIKTFHKKDPAEAIKEFDRMFIRIFTTKAQTETIRKFLSPYGGRVYVHGDGSVEIDGLYLIDSVCRANMLIGLDSNGEKRWTYLCVQPISRPAGYTTMVNGKEVVIEPNTVLTLAKAWYLLNRHLYKKDRVFYDQQISKYEHLKTDLLNMVEKYGDGQTI